VLWHVHTDYKSGAIGRSATSPRAATAAGAATKPCVSRRFIRRLETGTYEARSVILAKSETAESKKSLLRLGGGSKRQLLLHRHARSVPCQSPKVNRFSMDRLSDGAIAELIAEGKSVPAGLMPLVWASERNGHRVKNLNFKGESGNIFEIIIRQSCVNPMNFSVILGHMLPGAYTIFRLRRYNGKSHEHTNYLEKDRFYDFHIHQATERYQDIAGFKEDHFATRCDKFVDLHGAIKRLVSDCGFKAGWEDSPLFKTQK
jgi:hypothetical protein